ncbi:MAG TPA: ribonuclease Z [Planctomycetota bacterium]|nr:ribonuclease Z [Planctomycetota bacterium]
MGAEWCVLGAGSIQPRAGYGPAGYALRPAAGAAVTLFDCGPGTLRNLPGVGIGLLEIERVVLSHYHLDHCLDLLAFAFARRNPALGTPRPLEVIGPRGLLRLVEGVEGPLGVLARDPALSLVEVEPVAGREPLERGDLRLTWTPTEHTSEALAWRADLPGAALAYSGDSPETPGVADLARGVDLFTVECSHADGHGVPGHLTPSSAARLAARAGARRLLLTHFYPQIDPEEARVVAARTFAGEILVARDGLRVPLAY